VGEQVPTKAVVGRSNATECVDPTAATARSDVRPTAYLGTAARSTEPPPGAPARKRFVKLMQALIRRSPSVSTPR